MTESFGATKKLTDLTHATRSLAEIVLGDAPLPVILERVATIASENVPGADAVSVTLIDGRGAHTEAISHPLALGLDERQYESAEGPCLTAARTGVPVVVDDMATDPRWPVYGPLAAALGAASSLSVPLPLVRDTFGALNIYSVRTCAFDETSLQIGEAFVGYAMAAMVNASEYEELATLAAGLATALESRAVIDQAKGVLMSQRGCDADEAFEILRTASQNYNRKLRDVALGVVESTARGPSTS